MKCGGMSPGCRVRVTGSPSGRPCELGAQEPRIIPELCLFAGVWARHLGSMLLASLLLPGRSCGNEGVSSLCSVHSLGERSEDVLLD